jgi:hypothetical protein
MSQVRALRRIIQKSFLERNVHVGSMVSIKQRLLHPFSQDAIITRLNSPDNCYVGSCLNAKAPSSPLCTLPQCLSTDKPH